MKWAKDSTLRVRFLMWKTFLSDSVVPFVHFLRDKESMFRMGGNDLTAALVILIFKQPNMFLLFN